MLASRHPFCYTNLMTVLEQFVSFAKALPADRLHSVERALATLMETYSGSHEFTDEELAELDRRMTEASPQFSDPAEISKLFGKPFSA